VCLTVTIEEEEQWSRGYIDAHISPGSFRVRLSFFFSSFSCVAAAAAGGGDDVRFLSLLRS
jgi:hypothetical protein